MDIFSHLISALQQGLLHDNAFRTRTVGLISEAEFAEYYNGIRIDGRRRLLNGGYFIPCKEKKGALEDFIYYTVINSKEDLNPYLELYHHLSKLNGKAYYLISAHLETSFLSWSDLEINNKSWKVPEVGIFKYDPNRKSFLYIGDSLDLLLEKFFINQIYKVPDKKFLSDEVIKFENKFNRLHDIIKNQIYFERFILDVFIGLRHFRGIPSDIDAIVYDEPNPGCRFIFLEIKEKDLARAVVGFGLDKHRIKDIRKISSTTGIPYYLVVKHVQDQISRKIVDWKTISIHDFEKNMEKTVYKGGTGMRSALSYNPTFICPVGFFKPLK